MVEQYHPEILGQPGRDEAPQVLIASEPVGEHDYRPVLGTGDHDIVPATHACGAHSRILPPRHAWAPRSAPPDGDAGRHDAPGGCERSAILFIDDGARNAASGHSEQAG